MNSKVPRFKHFPKGNNTLELRRLSVQAFVEKQNMYELERLSAQAFYERQQQHMNLYAYRLKHFFKTKYIRTEAPLGSRMFLKGRNKGTEEPLFKTFSAR